MLLTGLSTAIFWPITVLLLDAFGWRGTCALYAVLALVVCLPIHVFVIPAKVRETAQPARPAADGGKGRAEGGATFLLIVVAVSLNAFVTYGFSAVIIELFKAEGLSAAEAVALGASLGFIQVAARFIDFLGGNRWDGITTGVIAGLVLILSMLLLMKSDGSYAMILAFTFFYGIGSGAFAVARATIPLAFYDKEAFARATARIALPINLLSAAAPPALAGLLVHFGSGTVLAVTTLCSLGALTSLLFLRKRRAVAA